VEVEKQDKILKSITQAKLGNREAFSYLYEEFYPKLFSFVNFKTRDTEKTNDIVADTFLNWYKSLDTYEVKQKPINYLYTIATRLIINDSQKKKSLALGEEAEDFIPDENISAEDLSDINLNFQKVKNIIDEKLNDVEKQVIDFKYLKEMENSEIAKILNKSENNIRQIEFRALQKIRNNLKYVYAVGGVAAVSMLLIVLNVSTQKSPNQIFATGESMSSEISADSSVVATGAQPTMMSAKFAAPVQVDLELNMVTIPEKEKTLLQRVWSYLENLFRKLFVTF
jgi:RNA polymerase sigma-70 factor (ECF subfamily)